MDATNPSLAATPTRLFLPDADVELAALQGLVSGGGAGHEPMHAGFVGRGGLDAAELLAHADGT